MKCPRCQGCLHFEQLEFGEAYYAKCLNCGFRENTPLPERPMDGRKLANQSRGYRTTACPQGHVYTPATTYFYKLEGDGRVQRKCKICARSRGRKVSA